jgi:D-alanyl-D-alanine carboxypeptidase
MSQATKRTGKKLLLLLISLSGVIIAAVVGYIGRSYIRQKQVLADFIQANPQTTAVAVYTFDENGDPIEDEYTYFHNADTPLVLASTIKIVVLAAYADAVSEGALDPAEAVRVSEWEKYYLPASDGGAHGKGLASVGLKADEHGFALDPTATVPLDELARIMIHYSGNAATDYLIERIGPERLTAVMTKIGFQNHTPIRPLLGFALAIYNHDYASFKDVPLDDMIADVTADDASRLDALMTLYIQDPDWRNEQIAFITAKNSSVEVNAEEIWAYQVRAAELLPKGTAREYAMLMAKIASGQLISAQVSAIMQQKLENIPANQPLMILYLDRLGAKDGITAGTLAMASYAQPKRGPVADRSRVAVILANQIPLTVFPGLAQFDGHYLLATDLARAANLLDHLSNGQ